MGTKTEYVSTVIQERERLKSVKKIKERGRVIVIITHVYMYQEKNKRINSLQFIFTDQMLDTKLDILVCRMYFCIK